MPQAATILFYSFILTVNGICILTCIEMRNEQPPSYRYMRAHILNNLLHYNVLFCRYIFRMFQTIIINLLLLVFFIFFRFWFARFYYATCNCTIAIEILTTVRTAHWHRISVYTYICAYMADKERYKERE